MTQNANISILRYCRKNTFVFFAFCVITVLPIMIQTCSAPRNDRLNLSFVKDFHIVGTKLMARNGRKMTIYQMQILMINL